MLRISPASTSPPLRTASRVSRRTLVRTRHAAPGAGTGLLGGQGRPSGVGQRPAELPARADAELGEYLAQVPLDGARTEEQLGADLRIRQPVTGEPGDLRLLRGELARRLGPPLAHVLPGGQQLAAGAPGEPPDPHHGQHLVGLAERLACVYASARAAQPLAVEQMSPGQLRAELGTAEPVDRLAIEPF